MFGELSELKMELEEECDRENDETDDCNCDNVDDSDKVEQEETFAGCLTCNENIVGEEIKSEPVDDWERNNVLANTRYSMSNGDCNALSSEKENHRNSTETTSFLNYVVVKTELNEEDEHLEATGVAKHLQIPLEPLKTDNDVDEKDCTTYKEKRTPGVFSDTILLGVDDVSKQTVNSKTQTYECEFCMTVFPSARHLNAHSHIHKEKLYQCKDCDKCFGSPKNLKAHTILHGEKPYICETCSKSFAKEACLKQHMNVHTKELVCKCEVCHKTFSKRTNLNRHITNVHSASGRLHTLLKYQMRNAEEKITLYKCEICDKSYMHARDLKSHMTIHSDSTDDQNICLLCSKVFDRKYNLKRHLKTHTDERAFMCEFCFKSFRDESYLKYHIRHHCILAQYYEGKS